MRELRNIQLCYELEFCFVFVLFSPVFSNPFPANGLLLSVPILNAPRLLLPHFCSLICFIHSFVRSLIYF